MLETKPFTKSDFDCFSGVKSKKPSIAHIATDNPEIEVTVIFDKNTEIKIDSSDESLSYQIFNPTINALELKDTMTMKEISQFIWDKCKEI